jgi:hypothetical protein
MWPLLTSAPARRPLLDAAPDPVAGPGEQTSLSKDANFPCATAPFTSGAEHRTLLCWAGLSAPSALYGVSVRRLIKFEVGFLPTGPRDPAAALLYRLRHPAAHAGQPDDSVPARGDFHPASSRPCQAHPVGPATRRRLEDMPTLGDIRSLWSLSDAPLGGCGSARRSAP